MPSLGLADGEASQFTRIDVAPNGVDWNVPWTGQRPTADDLRLYTPQLTLTNPPLQDTVVTFDIMAASGTRNARIGTFTVTYRAGSRSYTLSMNPNEGARVTPEGAGVEQQGFWIACTRNGRIRSNVGPAESGGVALSISVASQDKSGPYAIGGLNVSPPRAINCLRYPTG